MKYREYGFGKKHSIILLHGGGLSWWNYKEVAEILQNKYHVILPILDGHADSDNPFSSIEDNAEEIIKFIDSIEIISNERKKFYKQIILIRYDILKYLYNSISM